MHVYGYLLDPLFSLLDVPRSNVPWLNVPIIFRPILETMRQLGGSREKN